MPKVYINESGKDQTYELFDDSTEVAFGRGAASDVQIADGHASKHHLVLRRQRGRWKLVDLESKNGTRVNGAFRNAHWLTHGDTVTVGSVVLRFDAEGQPRPAARAGGGPARGALGRLSGPRVRPPSSCRRAPGAGPRPRPPPRPRW
jgi:pSer/pThr/pTyr-binding forkhead associated (FHA) protein